MWSMFQESTNKDQRNVMKQLLVSSYDLVESIHHPPVLAIAAKSVIDALKKKERVKPQPNLSKRDQWFIADYAHIYV